LIDAISDYFLSYFAISIDTLSSFRAAFMSFIGFLIDELRLYFLLSPVSLRHSFRGCMILPCRFRLSCRVFLFRISLVCRSQIFPRNMPRLATVFRLISFIFLLLFAAISLHADCFDYFRRYFFAACRFASPYGAASVLLQAALRFVFDFHYAVFISPKNIFFAFDYSIYGHFQPRILAFISPFDIGF